jgi:hypothetical protein
MFGTPQYLQTYNAASFLFLDSVHQHIVHFVATVPSEAKSFPPGEKSLFSWFQYNSDFDKIDDMTLEFLFPLRQQ